MTKRARDSGTIVEWSDWTFSFSLLHTPVGEFLREARRLREVALRVKEKGHGWEGCYFIRTVAILELRSEDLFGFFVSRIRTGLLIHLAVAKPIWWMQRRSIIALGTRSLFWGRSWRRGWGTPHASSTLYIWSTSGTRKHSHVSANNSAAPEAAWIWSSIPTTS